MRSNLKELNIGWYPLLIYVVAFITPKRPSTKDNWVAMKSLYSCM